MTHGLIELVADRTIIRGGAVWVAGDRFHTDTNTAAELVQAHHARLVDMADMGVLLDVMRARSRLPAHLRGRFVQTR